MNKLISAEIRRMLRSKIFWICTAAVFVTAIFIMQMSGIAMKNGRICTMDEYFFYLGPMIALFFSVFISMFLGTEHSDGTVRNKIIIGHTRTQIYPAYYLTCLAGTGLMIAVWFLGGLTGLPLLGAFKLGAVSVLVNIAITLLYCAVLTAMFTFFSVMIPNKATSAVTQIVLALLLILAGSMLYNHLCEPEMVSGMTLSVDGQIVMSEPEPNPMYIGGVMRQVCVALLNILPTGQGILMLNWDTSDSVPVLIPLQLISSVVLSFGITAAGMLIFRKKDLK